VRSGKYDEERMRPWGQVEQGLRGRVCDRAALPTISELSQLGEDVGDAKAGDGENEMSQCLFVETVMELLLVVEGS